MKTAIEFLEIEFSRIPFTNPVESIKKAKEIEKEQIIQARIDGDENYSLIGGKRYEYAEQYYNETYNQNKS